MLSGKAHYKAKINDRLENLVQIRDPNYKMAVRLKQDPELVALFKHIPKKIIMYYKKMYQLYTKGDWKKAKHGLNKIIKRKRDGPSLFIMEVMKEYNFIPPKKWKGVRDAD
jgi:hypothetical protein